MGQWKQKIEAFETLRRTHVRFSRSSSTTVGTLAPPPQNLHRHKAEATPSTMFSSTKPKMDEDEA